MAEHGQEIAEIEVLLLMLTPIARVVLSLIGFVRERDVLFSAIALLVLLTLGMSILIH